MTDPRGGSRSRQQVPDDRDPQLSRSGQGIDDELRAALEELERELDSDTVKQASEEVREQLRAEIRARVRAAADKAKASSRRKEAVKKVVPGEDEEFQRFSITFRIQHILLFTSCISLIITGLPLKFPNTAWAGFFFNLVGGVANSGTIHRIGAVGLIIVGIFHMIYIGLTGEGKREFKELLPKPKDVLDVFKNVTYFLGLARSGARFGRFSYIEKFDYWAVYWGMVVMITSGLMLWFQDQAMAFLPKFALDIAQEAHSDEALLATLAIIIWHMYNVHLNPEVFPMSRTWITGRISREQMIHHHPLEYEKIVSEREKKAGNGKNGSRD